MRFLFVRSWVVTEAFHHKETETQRHRAHRGDTESWSCKTSSLCHLCTLCASVSLSGFERGDVFADEDVVERPLIVLPVRPAGPEVPAVPVNGSGAAIAKRVPPAVERKRTDPERTLTCPVRSRAVSGRFLATFRHDQDHAKREVGLV